MKLININPKNLKLSPKRLFRSKKDKSVVSRSEPSSFCSGISSSSSTALSEDSTHKAGKGTAGTTTPTSVLPELSSEWTEITGEVQHDLVQAFKFIDRDNDGMVSRKELEALLTRIGGEPPSEEEVTLMLSEIDREGDGCIRVEALMNRVGSICGQSCDDSELRETFAFFDSDRDGKITAEELWKVFTAMGDDRCTLEDCQRMIEGVAKNGDGFVCFEDFQVMMEFQR